MKNEKVGSIDLPDEVFGQKVNGPLVLQVIKAQLAGLRQGTAKTKVKSEVRGGGKKPFRQKGTGNARQGSSRSPLMPGGGSSFGPKPRKYNQRTPKEMVRGALRSVLSDKLAAKHLVIVDKFDLKAPKTKELAATLTNAFSAKKALLVDAKNQNLSLASRNLPTVNFVSTDGINTYDVVKHDWLFLSKASAEALAARLA
ncbi:MAG: 50S ribosomal protein L4 [Deltaproteobacteria bacterium]|nr:50S ribosomal protein L4 [Deltaproteobacteria bacterium]